MNRSTKSCQPYFFMKTQYIFVTSIQMYQIRQVIIKTLSTFSHEQPHYVASVAGQSINQGLPITLSSFAFPEWRI